MCDTETAAKTTVANSEVDGIVLVDAKANPEASLFALDPDRVFKALSQVARDIPVHDTSAENLFGQAVRNRRRQLGLRQEDIATRLGVSRGLVSQWEQGTTRISAKDLVRVAEALGVTVADLFGHPAVSNLLWLSPRAHAATNDEELADVLRREHQEKILLSLFDAMTHEQRERVLRVVQALRE